MEAGPLSSSLMARREVVVGRSQEQTISDEQIRQLLIFMGTITVISFVLVIALITVFIAFIWYSRSRLQGCSCHNKQDKELEVGGVSGHHLRHGPPQPPASSSNGHNTVKMFAVQPGQFQLRRSHKNVIVNPLPGTLHHHHHHPLTGGPTSRTDLGAAAINQSLAGGGQLTRVREDELGQIESGGSQEATEEPIYAEIKPSQGEIKSSLGEIKLEKILKAEQESENPSGVGGGGMGKKKEIEYWQITAKEVVKFRPCTETFIQRE